jgi:hypothetical protein
MYTCSSCDTRPSRAVTVISRRAMFSESSAAVRRAGYGRIRRGRVEFVSFGGDGKAVKMSWVL